MRLKSPWGGKTDAEDEPLAFRSGVFVFVVRFGGAGCGYQADGSGPAALWDLHVRVFSAGAVRAGVGDVPGAWIARQLTTPAAGRGRLGSSGLTVYRPGVHYLSKGSRDLLVEFRKPEGLLEGCRHLRSCPSARPAKVAAHRQIQIRMNPSKGCAGRHVISEARRNRHTDRAEAGVQRNRLAALSGFDFRHDVAVRV